MLTLRAQLTLQLAEIMISMGLFEKAKSLIYGQVFKHILQNGFPMDIGYMFLLSAKCLMEEAKNHSVNGN